MFGSKNIDWIGKDFPTCDSTTKTMDRPLIRIPILPQHRAIEVLIKSGYAKNAILSILALSQYYGVRPPIFHDSMRPNSNINTRSRQYLDCLGNNRIYVGYPSSFIDGMTIYMFLTRISRDMEYIELQTIARLDNNKFIDLPCLPQIKKGNYNLAEKYSEILTKLKT